MPQYNKADLERRMAGRVCGWGSGEGVGQRVSLVYHHRRRAAPGAVTLRLTPRAVGQT